jgi:hypothetical protein
MANLFDDYARIEKENKNLFTIYCVIADGGLVFVILSLLLT